LETLVQFGKLSIIMDPLLNPFAPGAGAAPPELVGRQSLLEDAGIAIERLRRQLHAKGLLITGLRGVGKTVVLYRIRNFAEDADCPTVFTEATEDGSFLKKLALELQPTLKRFQRGSPSALVKKALNLFKSFSVGVGLDGNLTFGVDIDPDLGSADTGDVEVDLRRLFVALGEVAKERDSAFVIGIDELQYLSREELSAVIAATQAAHGRSLPVAVFGAGLPNLPALAAEAKTYAERLFDFPAIGSLTNEEVRQAVEDPAARLDVTFEDGAADEIARVTEGYPYFVQEWAHDAWNAATGNAITLEDVRAASQTVKQRLDRNFFRVRLDRLTPREVRYSLALAELGPGAHRTGDIAEQLGATPAALGSLRESLVRKGMIYSPNYGEAAFTAPLFDAFLRDHASELTALVAGRSLKTKGRR
jgi:hypothetical protein